MANFEKLLKRLASDFPALNFKASKRFSYRKDTITFIPTSDGAPLLLLHELAHAVLSHSATPKIIDRLAVERDAWEYVKNVLAPKYRIAYDEDFAHKHLVTYQNYLHKKSLCPKCRQPRLETKPGKWHCSYCI